MNNALEDLLQQPGIWRGSEPPRSTGLEHAPTGYAELDRCLPGGGWPLGALTEILHEQPGIGELRLLMPALARLSRQGRWVAIIAPPFIPYAPALAAHGIDLSRLLLVHPKAQVDTLWALEQALRAGTCGAVVAWPEQLDERRLRRLQLAAEAGRSWGVLFRSAAQQGHSSPAALRLLLEHREQALNIRFLKCRGTLAPEELRLELETPASRLLPETNPALRSRLLRSRRSQSQLDLPLTPPPQDRNPLRQSPSATFWRS